MDLIKNILFLVGSFSLIILFKGLKILFSPLSLILIICYFILR